MKKLTAFLLIALLCISLFSCAQKQSEEIIPEYDSSIPGELDLEGSVVTYSNGWAPENFPTIGDSAAGDAAWQRVADVEKQYNCDIVINKDTYEMFIFNLAVSEYTCDFIDLMGGSALSCYKLGVFEPIENISTIDLTNEAVFGYERFLRYGMFDNIHHYGFAPNGWQNILHYCGIMFSNNDLLRRMGIPLPAEMIEEGTWDWQHFKENLSACLSQTDTTPLAMNGGGESNAILTKTALFSNGVEILSQSDSGKYTCNLKTPEAFTAYDYVRSLIDENLAPPVSVEWTSFSIDETAPYFLGETWHGTNYTGLESSDLIADNLSDYSFLSFPSGPDAKYGENSAYVFYNRRLQYVCNTGKNDLEQLGIIITALFQPLGENGEFAWQQYARRNTLTEDDFERVLYMLENIKYDYSTFLGLDATNKMNAALEQFQKWDTTAAEAVDSVIAIIEDAANIRE